MIDFFTHSPHFYDYVAWAVIVIGTFNLAEIFLLLHNKDRVEKLELKKLKLKRLLSTKIITEETPASSLPKPADEADFEAYSETIASILDSFEGEVADRAKSILTVMEVDKHYHALAGHRTWYKRGNAIDILASFKLDSNRDFFLRAFDKESSADVKYRIIYALSFLVRDPSEIKQLSLMLSSLPHMTAKYTEDVFYNIISSLKATGKEREFAKFMTETLKNDSINPKVKRDILTACHAALCAGGRDIIQAYYKAHPEEPEILIGALKSLSAIGDFTFIPDALRKPDWRVRMTALRSADLCCMDMVDDIRAMLRDPNYHVRLEAALTLGRAGGKALTVLKEEAVSSDKFASEAAAYALTQVPS